MQEAAARANVWRYERTRHGHDPDDVGRAIEEVSIMGILKLIGAALGVLIAAAVLVPLIILAGLFIWLKLTEEADEEALELEQEAGI